MGYVLGVLAVGTLWNGATVIVGILRPSVSDGFITFCLTAIVAVGAHLAVLRWAFQQELLRDGYETLIQLQWAFFAAPLGIFLAWAARDSADDAVGAAAMLIAFAVVVLITFFLVFSLFFPWVSGGNYPALAETLKLPPDASHGDIHERYLAITHSGAAIVTGIASFIFAGVLSTLWGRSATGDKYRAWRLHRRYNPGRIMRFWRGV